eukprot:NODE_5171_length_973_cov_114.824706_g4961_i0.p1 GENE.NODE_5171_length_973_cov_114.824706_g4961_i0~~NODE_5171_length_973_cov_114.824706_g4961_i0.p1  ORF type:complete len:195 (-),score=26.95 NODE_5171_length_973_cov_114.824706_g4961_i0:140-724(-)
MIWTYVPWIIWLSSYWRPESLYFLVLTAEALIFWRLLDTYLSTLHEHFAFIGTLMIAVLTPLLLVYWAWARVSVIEILLAGSFYAIIWSVINASLIGLWNLWFKRKYQLGGYTLGGNILGRQDVDRDKMYLNRMSIPRWHINLQRVFPMMALAFFGILNWLLIMVNSGLTAMLFNGAVAEAWTKAKVQANRKRD